MNNIEHDRCSLCREPATYVWADHGNRKFFNCANCGKFKITTSALRTLDQENQGIWRSQLAAEARSLLSDPDCMLLIDMDEDHQLRCKKVRQD